MRVYKSVFTVSVYSDDPLPPNLDLPDILRECDEGPYICGIAVGPVEVLTDPGHIRDEMYAIGNDGSFFDDHAAIAAEFDEDA